MLVRDIELVPAIVDLVDNSVDGARRLTKGKASGKQAARSKSPLSKYHVDITLSGESFTIADNCGGISIEDATRYAFRFGRPEDIAPLEGEVGQFGVGMKRALFKLGQEFSVTSVAAASEFVVEVDVQAWLKEKRDWTFPLSYVGPRRAGRELGTTIQVADLLPSVAAEFGAPTFVQRLRDQIEFRHSTAMEEGLKVTLNGHRLKSRAPTLLAGSEVLPRVVHETISANGDTVDMRLYAGFVDLKDEDADTDNPDEFTGGSLAGWYLICNGRMLLFADRTRLTGWGLEVADYHPQYRRFRGYVFLSGNSSAMPWNTAKTTVDEDSSVWRIVRTYIVDALRDARSVMNRIKTEVQSNDAKDRPVTSMLKAAQATRLVELDASPEIVVPPRPPKRPPTTKKISYDVTIDEFNEVKDALEVSTAVDVGRETFAYYYRREVE
jgi:Histidine kinase-, DNA gyrase B-, and HSP90-like ATPase